MLTRWRLPPDRRPTSSPARSRRPVCSSIRVDRGLDVGDLLQAREQPQVLGHRELRVQRRLLRHPADLPRAQRHGARASAPARPARICSSVVLPAPLGPMIATSSPRPAAKVTSRSAVARRRSAWSPRPRAGRRRPSSSTGPRLLRAREAAADAASSASPSSVPHAGQAVGARPARRRRTPGSAPRGSAGSRRLRGRRFGGERRPGGRHGGQVPRLERAGGGAGRRRVSRRIAAIGSAMNAPRNPYSWPPSSSAKITSSGLMRSACANTFGRDDVALDLLQRGERDRQPQRVERLAAEQRDQHRRERADRRADVGDQLGEAVEGAEEQRVRLAVGEDPERAEDPQQRRRRSCP